MSQIKETPIIVQINEGEITNSTNTVSNKSVPVDVFNGTKDSFNNQILKRKQDGKYTIGNLIPFDSNFNLNNVMTNRVAYLNGEKTTQMVGYELIVGTHIGQTVPKEDLYTKEHIIKCPDYDISTRFNFVYVQMTTGVSDNFGEEKYRKSSQNNLGTGKSIKKMTEGKTVVGFSHYLTGNPKGDPKAVGVDQAHKFLKSIFGSLDNIKKDSTLDGCMRPMVIFSDNITQVGYYGSAPIGIKKDL